MRPLRFLALLLSFALPAFPAHAQKDKPEPLTEAQIELIREAGVYPNQRVELYTKFLNEHADVIKALTARGKSIARAHKLDDELQQFTALMDEFGDNLDVYSDRHADIRHALKPLPENTDRWLAVLRALPEEPTFELSRKEALESGQDLADQAKKMLAEQTAYFELHKDEQNQERAEPK